MLLFVLVHVTFSFSGAVLPFIVGDGQPGGGKAVVVSIY